MPRPRLIETPKQYYARMQDIILMRSLRSALGLSQRDLAKLLGIHFTTLAKAEKGCSRLKPVHMQAIMQIFQEAGIAFRTNRHGTLTITFDRETIDYIAQTTEDLYPYL